jgi:uncharacterized phage protein (TIGR02220 family)
MISLSDDFLLWLYSLSITESRAVIFALRSLVRGTVLDDEISIFVDELSDDEKKLLQRGLLRLCDVGVVLWSMKSANMYCVSPQLVNEQKTFSIEMNSDENVLSTHAHTFRSILYILSINYINTNTNINTAELKQARQNKLEHSDIFTICSYLNEKTGSRYKHTSAAFAKLVSARLNEGFSLDDFKQVIDTKVSSWTGTDFEKYLRPQTLFGNKFESYLNERSPELSKKRAESKAHSYLSSVMAGE